MQRFIISLVVLLAFSATGSYAHGPEGHGPKTLITESQAGVKATQLVATIVKKGQLDASWLTIQPAEIQKKTVEGRPGAEWVVTFNNPAVKDAAKQKLYVFLSLYGEYTGANYEGK
ncbi:MAG: DUF6488 family protein [Nitrospirota bacterium]